MFVCKQIESSLIYISFQYDLSASQFSPDGRVFQIDYAGKAIEQSGTLIGLRGANGVVLAVEKIVRSPLYEEDAGCRIYSIDKHIGIVSIRCPFETLYITNYSQLWIN